MQPAAAQAAPRPPALRAGLLDARFRTNPAYGVVEHRRLRPRQRRAFDGLAADPAHFGLLIPSIPELGVVAVDRDLARLVEALRAPGRLPRFARRSLGGRGALAIARLVLDGVLELERDEGGFVGGPAAHAQLLAAPPAEPGAGDRLGELALAALRLAEALPGGDPRATSLWLYAFGGLPTTPRWLCRLGRRERFEDAFGLSPGGAAWAALEGSFSRSELPGWSFWHHHGRKEPGGDDEPTYKLYVSPHPDALGEVLPVIARRLAAWPAPAFKLGRGVHGVLRPDKLIIYLGEGTETFELAAALAADLAGCPSHGVPFTAALAPDGLLSWGMDPPRGSRIAGWRGVESWRLWVTDRLARALLRARALGSGTLAPWRYALLRLALEGVGVEGWLPSPALWLDEEEAA